MSTELIGELAGLVARLLQAGAVAVVHDDHFGKLLAALKRAARKVPALAPLAADCERVRQGPESGVALLDLALRLRQVRSALAAPGLLKETLSPLRAGGCWRTPLPSETVEAVVRQTSSKLLKAWEALNAAVEAAGALDLRLVEPAAELAVYHQARRRSQRQPTPLPGWVSQLAEDLERRLNLHGDNRDALALGMLVEVAPEVGLRLCRQAVLDSSEAVQQASLWLLLQHPPSPDLIPAMLGLLEHRSYWICDGAVRYLQRLGLPAVPALLAAVGDPVERRWHWALWTLRGMLADRAPDRELIRDRLLPEVPRLRETLADPTCPLWVTLELLARVLPDDPETRQRVVGMLRADEDQETRADLGETPRQSDEVPGGRRRRDLFSYFGNCGVPDESVLTLIADRARRDASHQARRSAIEALGKLAKNSPAALDMLLDLFDLNVDGWLCEAAWALHGLKQQHIQPALPRLNEMLRGKDQTLQLSALDAVQCLGPQAAPLAQGVIRLTHSRVEKVRRAALKALRKLGAKVEGVAQALLTFQGSESDRSIAISHLVNLKPPTPELLGMLLGLLPHEDPSIRAPAVQGLATFGRWSEEVLPALESLRNDPDAWVRRVTCETLGRLGPRSRTLVALLRKFLGDREFDVHRQAAMSLGWIGSEAKPALPALRKLAEKHTHDKAFRKAVERIDKPAGE